MPKFEDYDPYAKCDNIVDKVQKFFYENDDFANSFEEFAKDKCDIFNFSTEEHSLEYTEIYQEFIRMFEEKLEDFIEGQGSSVQEFYDKIRKAQFADEGSDEAIFAQIMMATVDYDIFMQMMQEAKRSKSKK